MQNSTDRIISRPEFRELTGLSRTSEWRGRRDGKLPPVVRVGDRIIGYRESDYLKWLAANSG